LIKRTFKIVFWIRISIGSKSGSGFRQPKLYAKRISKKFGNENLVLDPDFNWIQIRIWVQVAKTISPKGKTEKRKISGFS
jgi:hypothetical protein